MIAGPPDGSPQLRLAGRAAAPYGGAGVMRRGLAQLSLPPESRERLERILVFFSALFALWILATTIYLARIGWAAIPIADDWDRWTTYFRDHYTVWWFWQQHVDHRIWAPKLLFLADHLLFHGRGWFLLICAFCLQGLTGLMLWRLSARAFQQELTERWIFAAWIVACLFAAQQWFNFIMPFQVQFPMVYCAALAAFYALWKATQQDPQDKVRRALWFALCMGAALVSTYSMANGVLLWPLLLLAAFWLRMSWRPIAVLAAVATVVIRTYLYHFNKAIVLEHLPASEKPQRVAVFLLAQLGAPMAPLTQLATTDKARLAIAMISGVLVLLALITGFVLLWLRRGRDAGARAMLMFFCLFLAGACSLIAYGRSQDTPFDAFLSKYLTPPYILWATILLVCWPLLRILPRVFLYSGVCTAILLVITIHQSYAIGIVRDQAEGARLAEIAVADNVTDQDAWDWINHPMEDSQETIELLRNNRLTMFTEEWTHWTGIPVLRRFSIDRNPDDCQGKIEDAAIVPSKVKAGWRLHGWAWDTKAARSPRYIVFGDESGTVAGVALSGFPLPPALAALPAKYVASSWSGYVGGKARPVTAYVLEADNRSLCSIGSVKLRLTGSDVPFTELGPLLPFSAPEIAGGFAPDGYYKGPGSPGPSPAEGPVFGSFPDINQGTIRLGPFHLDGQTEIAIPMVTGPDKTPLSIMVRDAGTQAALSEMSPPPTRTNWWAWHPDLPERELNIEIVATDKGTTWGQWIAVGWPHVLKKQP